MLTVPALEIHVHSVCENVGMLSVALPPVLVATGATVGGAPLVPGVLLSVPQTWAVPAFRLTFWTP
jgi:hypothetical protein